MRLGRGWRQVLSDEGQRAKYDQFGHMDTGPQGGGNGAGGPGPSSGFGGFGGFGGSGPNGAEFDPFEAFFGRGATNPRGGSNVMVRPARSTLYARPRG